MKTKHDSFLWIKIVLCWRFVWILFESMESDWQVWTFRRHLCRVQRDAGNISRGTSPSVNLNSGWNSQEDTRELRRHSKWCRPASLPFLSSEMFCLSLCLHICSSGAQRFGPIANERHLSLFLAFMWQTDRKLSVCWRCPAGDKNCLFWGHHSAFVSSTKRQKHASLTGTPLIVKVCFSFNIWIT